MKISLRQRLQLMRSKWRHLQYSVESWRYQLSQQDRDEVWLAEALPRQEQLKFVRDKLGVRVARLEECLRSGMCKPLAGELETARSSHKALVDAVEELRLQIIETHARRNKYGRKKPALQPQPLQPA